MQNIYSYSTGMVKSIEGIGLPALINLYGAGGADTTAYGFITQVQGEDVVGHQFAHTLSDYIYAYIFGDRMGTLAIAGKAITRGCGGTSDIGVDIVSNFYYLNRMARTYLFAGQPLVQVSIGTAGTIWIRGFLVKLQMQMTHPDTPFADFTMTLKTIPPV